MFSWGVVGTILEDILKESALHIVQPVNYPELENCVFSLLQDPKELEAKSSMGSKAKKGLFHQYLAQLQRHPLRTKVDTLSISRLFMEILILLNFSLSPYLVAGKLEESRRKVKV
jgi:hypothetical protein